MKFTIITILIITVYAIAIPVLAQDFDFAEQEEQNTAFLEEAGLGTTPISIIISDIIKLFLSFLGVIFIILIIYAGFIWMTAAGNDEKISTAKSTMTAAIIGLAVVLAAYAITYFVIDQILESTKGGQGLD